MIIFNFFVKITGFIVQLFCFKTKVFYENKKIQSRRIKGRAILVSNHTSVYDYAVMTFVFFSRVLRYQMAEVLFKKKFLGWFLRSMGGLKIDRYNYDNSAMDKSVKVLNNGGVVGVFPEGRLPKEGEERPLPFKEGAVYLACATDTPIIPVYTNGSYFSKKRAKVVIGTPIKVSDYFDDKLSQKENLQNISEILRQKIIGLQEYIK